jgi:hypothetical protein
LYKINYLHEAQQIMEEEEEQMDIEGGGEGEGATENAELTEGYTEQEKHRPKKKRGGMRSNPFYADL